MRNKLNKTGVFILFASTLIIALAMAARRLPLLADFGPKYWFQYFIAMFGFFGVGAGLLIKSITYKDNSPSDHLFAILMILGGLYLFVMGFVVDIKPRLLDWSISGAGVVGATIGYIYLFDFQNKFLFLRHTNPNLAKILVVAWIATLLACFLLYWGAPVEFWQIMSRFGINSSDGSLLRKIQQYIIRFFTFS